MPHVVHVFTVPDSLVFLRGQVDFMKRRGYTISVVTSPGPDLDAFGARESVGAFSVEMPRRISPAADLRGVARLAALFRRLEPDIVHGHTPKGGLLAMLAARAAGVRARVYHMRGLPMETQRGAKRLLLAATERVSCANAKRVLCVSRSLRREALEAKLVAPEKVRVLASGSGNGVDAAGRFNPARVDHEQRRSTRLSLGIPENALVVGFVGRLVRDKGIGELAAAWRSLRDRFAAAHLLLVGRFEERDPVPDAVMSALERDPRVHLSGFRADTPLLYAAMDVVALPTYREGFPNVPLEAAAMSLPVVGTRATGCVDSIVDGVTGALVDVRDAEGLAAALTRYLASEELRRSHGAAGRARALREFAPERLWSELDEFYREVLAG
jgi:glycosyltransferase involved in cell wall biosynthesis